MAAVAVIVHRRSLYLLILILPFILWNYAGWYLTSKQLQYLKWYQYLLNPDWWKWVYRNNPYSLNSMYGRGYLVAYLGRHSVPTVFLDRVVEAPAGDASPFDQVCAENAEPTARLVTHLTGLGHRRIGLVAGLPGLSTTRERITGYRHGLAAAGLPHDERLVVHGDSESAAEAAEVREKGSVKLLVVVLARGSLKIGAEIETMTVAYPHPPISTNVGFVLAHL